MKLRRLVPRTVHVLFYGSLIVAASIGMLHLPWTRGIITSAIETALSSETQRASVRGLSGIIPFDMRLAQFALADADGVWLEVENATLDLSLRDLLRLAVTIQEVGAERITLHRTPRPAAEPPPSESEGLPAIPELPGWLPAVAVERLYVDRLELGEPLLGEPMALAIAGAFGTSPAGDAINAYLTVDGLDQAPLSMALEARFGLEGPTLMARVDANASDGLVGRLANMPELGDVQLRLAADGPLSAWRADLRLQAENLLRADLALDLAYSATPEIAIEGQVAPDGQGLPPEIAELLENGIDLELRAAQTGPGTFELATLKLDSAVATVAARALIDQQAGRLDISVDGQIDELARLSQLAGIPLEGAVSLRAASHGSMAEPAFDLSLRGHGLAADTTSLERLDADVALRPMGPLGEPFAGVIASGQIAAHGIHDAQQPYFADAPVTLAFDASVPAEGAVTLRQLVLTASGLQANVTGDVDPNAGAGTLALTAEVAELAVLLDALSVDAEGATGAAVLRADLDLADSFQVIAGDVQIDGSALGDLPAGADALVGPAPTLRTAVQADLRERASLDHFELNLAALTISGTASAGWVDEGALAGDIRLAMPDLTALEPIFQQPLAGVAEVNLALAGTVDAPQADLVASISQAVLAGQRFDEIRLTADGADLVNAPVGKIDLRARQRQATLALSTGYAIDGQRLQLAGVSLTGPATRIGGDLDIDLANTLVGGRLAGDVQDVAALRPWHGQELRGRLSVNADLSHAQGRQRAVLDLDVPELTGEFGELRQLTVDADVDDALGVAGIDATIALGGFTQADIAVSQARIDARGRLSELAIRLSAEGSQANAPLSLESQATLDVAGAAQTIRLERLEARAAGQDISLRQPATIVIDAGAVDIDRLELNVGEALIQGRLESDGDRLDGGLLVETLPLPMLAAFGAPDFAGEIGGELTLKGSAAAPTIDLRLNVGDLRPNDRAHRPGSGIDAELLAGLSQAGAEARLEIGGLGQEPGIVTVRVPARLSLQPFDFDLPDSAPLDGGIDGVIDLTRLAALASLDGQTIQGLLDTDFTIGGTLARPTVDGQSQLRNGLVEDSLTGVSLKFVRAQLVKSPNGLALEDFQARDGDGGRLFAEGNFNLRASDGFPFEIKLTSDDMRVLSNDLGRVYVTADLDIVGDNRDGSVAGTINVTRAEIAIPSGGGIDPVELEVTAVGDNAPPTEEQAPAPADSAPAYVMDLDITVDMPARVFVRGRGLETEWGGRLAIGGTSAAPVVTGLIEYRRGFLDFLDRRFNISSGEIRFSGGDSPIPQIDISASARGTQIVAIITITGEATSPEFELRSEPPLPTDEILSDLLFQRNSSSITAAQALRLAAAVQALEGGGFDALGRLRRVIGVDTIDIGGDNPDDTSASVGKYIADGVFLEFERGLSTGTNRARIEVELTPNVSVNTEMTDDSQTSVGVEWRWDY